MATNRLMSFHSLNLSIGHLAAKEIDYIASETRRGKARNGAYCSPAADPVIELKDLGVPPPLSSGLGK